MASPPPSLGKSGDAWLDQLEAAKQLANDISGVVQARSMQQGSSSADASRATAAARKQLSALTLAIDKLRTSLEAREGAPITESERNRRRDLLTALKLRKDQLQLGLRRSPAAQNRDTLLGSDARGAGPAKETAESAGLDNQGLLQLQQRTMSQQDEELAELEKTVNSTKHIALTINEELGLHERLLDELDEDVETSHSRMRQAQKKLRMVMRSSGNCRSLCISILLLVALAAVILVGFKIIRYL